MGRFVLLEKIGAGAMGEVYRAQDPLLKREVAVKRLPPMLRGDPQFRARMVSEAQRASTLDCPHVAAVYDVVEESGEALLVMEYVRGGTLRSVIGAPQEPDLLLDIGAQCAEALAAAHEKYILHRDIKPDNIMLTSGGQVKVLDFGVAKRLRPAGPADTVSVAGNFAGTPGYMAPEVLLDQECDERSDIFSLGVVLWELATGRHPFYPPGVARTADRVLNGRVGSASESNPALPPEVDGILHKMLARDRDERYASARELLADLRAVRQATASGTLPRRWMAPRWKRRAAAAAAVLLLVLIAPLLVHIAGKPSLLPKQKFVAVLPFRTIGGDAEAQAFSDGLTQTLTARLSEVSTVPGLQVAPSSDLYSRHIASARAAHELLGANLVLDGSLHRIGDTVRISYALIDAGQNRQLRAHTITANASDVFGLEDRVVEAAIGMLEIELAPPDQEAGTKDSQAYAEYLEARGYLQRYDDPQNVTMAIAALDRAIALDPKFANAYAARGQSHWQRYDATHEPRWITLAEGDCRSALALDLKAAGGHICLATVLNGTGRYDAAAAEFQLALDRDPTSDEACRGLASVHEKLQNFAAAEATYQRAIRLRPHYWANYNWLGGLYAAQSRYADAVEMFRKASQLAPDSTLAFSNLGAAYILSGRYDLAREPLERSIAIHRNARALNNLAVVDFQEGRYGDAARDYEQALEFDRRNAVIWGNLAEALYWSGSRRTEAEAAYRTAIGFAEENLAVDPRSPGLLASAAKYHAMIGDGAKARQLLARATAFAPTDAEVLFKAGYVEERLGNRAAAITWLRRALAAGASPETVRREPMFAELLEDPRAQGSINIQREANER